MAKEYELIQTENPYVDKVVYYLKNLASGCVLKNPSEVLDNESIESLKNSDLYTHAIRGELSATLLDLLDEITPTIKKTVLGREGDGLKTYYDEIIDAYMADQIDPNSEFYDPESFWNYSLVRPYIDFLMRGKTRFNLIDYTELNGDNGLIPALCSFVNEPIDGVVGLVYETTLYPHITKVREGKHNLLLVPLNKDKRRNPNYNINPEAYPDDSDGWYSDYSKGYAVTSNEAEQAKFIAFASKYIIEHYVERNNYYRMLNGKPGLSEYNEVEHRIYLGRSTDDGTGRYSLTFDNEKYVDIFNDFYAASTAKGESYFRKNDIAASIDGPNASTAFGKLYIDELTEEELQILKNYHVIDNLFEIVGTDWNYKYINYIGARAIDPIKARLTPDFGYLYIADIDNENIYNRFKDRLDINRLFVTRTVYSEAYKYGSEYYDHFICILIIVLSMVDILSLMQEIILNKEVLDQRIIRYIFESNGIPYYSEIPLNYQINMVKNLNTLIKYKSSNKNVVDICSLFGFDNIEVFKYYLLKTRNADENGNFIEVTDDNLDEAYDLKFIKVPYQENVVDYINDSNARIEYENMIAGDPTWNAGKSMEYVKHKIIEKEFNLVKSKYISIDSTFDIASATTQIAYLMDLMYVDDQQGEVDEEHGDQNLKYLCKGITVPFQNANIPIGDMFLYLFALTFAYHGTKTAACTEFGYNALASATAIDPMHKSERYLAFDINQDLARLATLIQAKLNKNIIITPQTRDNTTTYVLQLSGITKTFKLTEEEYNAVVDDDENKYEYPSGKGTKVIYFTDKELEDASTSSSNNIYYVSHTFDGGEYDTMTLTEEEYNAYMMDTKNGIPKVRMYYDSLTNSWTNTISIYYYESNEVIPTAYNEIYQPNTLYIVDNRTGKTIRYKHPVDPFSSVPALYEFLNDESNTNGAMINLELLKSAMVDASSIEEYNLYKWIYDSLMISNRIKAYFFAGYDEETHKPKYYKSYQEYLRKYPVLSENLDLVATMMDDETADDSTRKEAISVMINNVISVLESINFSKYFKYAYNGIATVSGDYLASYIVKLIEFFKSYKVDIHDINAVYKFDDKFNNTVIMIDQIDMLISGFSGMKEYNYDVYGEDNQTSKYETNTSIIHNIAIPEDWQSNPNGEPQIRTSTIAESWSPEKKANFLINKLTNSNLDFPHGTHSAVFDILAEMLKYKTFTKDKDSSDNYDKTMSDSTKEIKSILKYPNIFIYKKNSIDDDISDNTNILLDLLDDPYEQVKIKRSSLSISKIYKKDGYDTFLKISGGAIYQLNLDYSSYNKNATNSVEYDFISSGNKRFAYSDIDSIFINILNSDISMIENERNVEVDITAKYKATDPNNIKVELYYIPSAYRQSNALVDTTISIWTDKNESVERQFNLYNISGYIGSYFGSYAGTNNDIIRRVLYDYITVIMKRTFGTVENVNDLISKLEISIGPGDSIKDQYDYEMSDIIYLIMHYTTTLFLTNKVLIIKKFYEGTNKEYISNTDIWQGDHWSDLSIEEKEEFYKELEILDKFVLNYSMEEFERYNDTDIEDIVKAIISKLHISSKDLYEQAQTKDDMNFDIDSNDIFKLFINQDINENYIADIIRDKIIQISGYLLFAKDTMKEIDTTPYYKDLTNAYRIGHFSPETTSECIHYIENPITGQTVETLYPKYQSGAGVFSIIYREIPVDFSKYRYYYTGANVRSGEQVPTKYPSWYIAFYTNRWESYNIEYYKEMVYAERFTLLPADCGFYEIKLDDEALDRTGFTKDDIKFITFSIYSGDRNFKLYRCLRDDVDTTAELVNIYDKVSNNHRYFNTGEVSIIIDTLESNTSIKAETDDVDLFDRIYIEEA